jgi:hypothetical protein
METIITYKPDTDLLEYSQKNKGYFNITISDENTNNQMMFRIDNKTISNIKQKFDYSIEYSNMKEQFYVKGINNLLKKNNLLQLSLQLSDNLITEDEFEEEINNNSEKYIISVENLTSVNQLHVLKDIVKSIGKDFSVDEISELFSVSFNNLDKILNH